MLDSGENQKSVQNNIWQSFFSDEKDKKIDKGKLFNEEKQNVDIFSAEFKTF